MIILKGNVTMHRCLSFVAALLLPFIFGCERKEKTPDMRARMFVNDWLSDLEAGKKEAVLWHDLGGTPLPKQPWEIVVWSEMPKDLSTRSFNIERNHETARLAEPLRPFQYDQIHRWEFLTAKPTADPTSLDQDTSSLLNKRDSGIFDFEVKVWVEKEGPAEEVDVRLILSKGEILLHSAYLYSTSPMDLLLDENFAPGNLRL